MHRLTGSCCHGHGAGDRNLVATDGHYSLDEERRDGHQDCNTQAVRALNLVGLFGRDRDLGMATLAMTS